MVLVALDADLTTDYHVALAYSNIQGINSVPPFVAGVITTGDLLGELKNRDLPRKRLLLRRRNSLFDLEQAFADISDYLTEHEIERVKNQQATQVDIESSYLKLLRILLSKHLRVLLGDTTSISLRLFEDPSDWKTRPFSQSFLDQVKRYSNAIKICDKDTFDRLLETAKILATLEFRRMQSTNGQFIEKIIEKHANECVQVLRLSWRSPSIEDYENYNVGFPAVVLRTIKTEGVDFTYLTPKMNVSLIPLGKFCRGYQEKQGVERCKKTTYYKPFGQQLQGSSGEQCWSCRNGHENTMCLSRVPLCDGFEVRCGKYGFAGNICSEFFALYIARFLDELKVGTSFQPNVIGRLLDQGPTAATVFYPIEGIGAVSLLERAVTKHLQKNIDTFSQFGIKKAYWKTPVDRRLRDFLSDWNRDDHELMETISDFVLNASILSESPDTKLSELERKVCLFHKNYLQPPPNLNNEYLKMSRLFKPAKGQIVGLRGSFIFLDSGYVVDLKRLQGYVLRGGFYE